MKEIDIKIKPLMAKLEMVYRGVISRGELPGRYTSVYRSRGTDFEGYREYLPSDDSRMIDWKASMRTQKLLVRILREERNLDVMFLFDVSDTMLCSSTSKLKCEYAAEVIASLAYAMMSVGDKVGIIMHNNKIVKRLLPETGLIGFHKLGKALSDPKNYGGGMDMRRAIRYMVSDTGVRQGTVIFIISDFLGLKDDWERSFKVAAQKYITNGILIKDPVDMEMPMVRGNTVVEDPISGEKMVVDPRTASEHFKMITEGQRKRLVKLFSGLNNGILELQTDKPFLKPTMKFLRRLSR